jgi:hypothetical protein
LAAYPPTVDFGTVPLPGHDTQGVSLVNTSGVDETVSAVVPPIPPFSSTNLPTVGQTIPAGASLAVPLDYAPTATSGADAGSLSVTVDPGGHQVTVGLSGTAVVGASKLELIPSTLHFGLVARGHSKSMTFEIANKGDILLTINKAKAPFGAFSTTRPVSEGQTLTPDQSVIQSVSFSPASKGIATAEYEVTGNDGSGQHFEALSGTDDQLTDRYNTHRSLRHSLGTATGSTHKAGHGYVRLFVHGEMFWSATAGIHYSKGRILRAYQRRAGARGTIGYPTTNLEPIHGGYQQKFQHARITWTRKHGIRVTRSH